MQCVEGTALRKQRGMQILQAEKCDIDMTEFAFEREAMQGKPLPKGLDIADSCLYVALKNLYAMYQNKLISRKDATEEKRRLVYNWTTDKAKLNFLNRDSETLRDKIGAASDEYKNNPCIETAEKLYAAFYNLPDDWRKK